MNRLDVVLRLSRKQAEAVEGVVLIHDICGTALEYVPRTWRRRLAAPVTRARKTRFFLFYRELTSNYLSSSFKSRN